MQGGGVSDTMALGASSAAFVFGVAPTRARRRWRLEEEEWLGWARRHRCQQLRPPPPPPRLCPHDNTIATGLNKTTSAIIPVG